MAEEVIGLLFGVDGGGSIDGRSGQQIVRDLAQIVNQINTGKTTVPKVQLKFDTSHAKTALAELKSQLQEIAGMGNISVSGMSSRGGSGGSAGVKQDAENYRALTATIKQYYAALAEVEKIQMKTTSVSSSGGVWSTTDAQYDARIQKINQLKMEFDKLGISVNAAGTVEMNSAQQLNIAEEQRAMLLTQVSSAITANGITHEKSAAQISAAWDKNADKATQYVRRIEDVASKNADVKKLMDEVLEIAASGDPKNLDKLTQKLANLQQTVRKTGADVKTFGDKFKKTFANDVRAALTGAIIGSFTKYLHDIYQNVIKIDKAMTDLQIASGKTREETKELIATYSELGRQLGATTAQVAESADTWLRQGYNTEEANTLIANSMMLSKLGQIESAEAATYLTSAMKGYNVTVQDSIEIVDKWTAVDMVAAANAGDLATAMAETSTSARIAGVSMDTLIGYIATVKEVTQDSAESVGTFMKTLFARMNNVAAGNFVDEETGESLNDVETVLNQLGIALRDANGQFRNSGEVLNEVAGRWQTFDSVAQHAIATAFAGTRQQEKFTTLMEHYGSAMEYAKTSTEAAGTAQQKYGAYTESIEGKMAALTATFEQLSMTILSADWIITGIEMLTGLVSVIESIASIGDGAVVAILAIATAVMAIVAVSTLASSSIKRLILHHAQLAGAQVGATVTTKAFTAALGHMSSTGLLGVILLIPRLIFGLISLIAQFGFAEVAALGFKGALELLNIHPVMLAITAAVTLLVGAAVAIKNYQKELENSAKQTQAAVDATIALNNKLKEEKDTLDDLIKSYYELAKANEGVYDTETREKILEIQNQINEIIKEEGSSVDLLNAKYSELGETMQHLARMQAEQALVAIQETKQSIQIIEDEGKHFYYGADTIAEHIVAVEKYGSDSAKEGLERLKALQNQIDILTDSLINFGLVYEDALARSNGAFGDDGIISNLDEYAAYKKSLIEAALANEDLQLSAEQATDAVEAFMQHNYGDVIAQLASDLYGTNYQMKGFSRLAEEVTKEFDALTEGFSEMEEQGALSLGTYQELLEVFPNLKDMEFTSEDGTSIKFLEETADGYYKLNGSIEDYIKLEQEKLIAVMASNAETSEAYKNAEEDLESLIRIQNTLLRSQEIEAAQKRLEEQLEKFEEIVDLRKELLKTYKEELDYQRELKKKQQTVTNIQTKLSVSRLDNSAAGQARTRELEQELKDAQDELDDFTLEHAIDVLTTQLETEKQEYASLINKEIDELRAISGSISSIEGYVNTLKGEMQKDEAKIAFNDLQQYVADNKLTAGGAKDAGYYEKLDAAVTASSNAGIATTREAIEGQITTWHTDGSSNGTPTPDGYQYISQVSKGESSSNIRESKGNNFILDVNGVTYAVQSNGSVLDATQAANASLTVGNEDAVVQEGTLVTINDVPYVYTYDGTWVGMENRPGFLGMGPTEDYDRLKAVLRQYHTGGFVGDEISIASNEEFAKLLKGEFVSTPAQMKRFMEETLPKIANYSATGGSNEFNAPLIEIRCESVTTESLPELERVVNDAVREIKKQLDSGMSRTGFKRTPTKRLT